MGKQVWEKGQAVQCIIRWLFLAQIHSSCGSVLSYANNSIDAAPRLA